MHRLKELDPSSERTQWRKCSEITNYACAKDMAEIIVNGDTIKLDLPVIVPDFTLRLTDVNVRGISVDGKPFAQASTRSSFKSGSFFTEGRTTFVAFDPKERQTLVDVY